jgi:cold-inducible RNA-binding protein
LKKKIGSITFRTIVFVRYFSYNYFSYGLFVQVLFVQIQRGGGKIPRQGGEKSSPKEQFMRGYTAPYARTFAPSPLVFVRKVPVRKIIVRKVILPIFLWVFFIDSKIPLRNWASIKYLSKFKFSVGNLPYQATEEDLGNYFMQSGNVVNVRIVYDRETRRPKGFGFCEFDSEQGASDAVNRLNGTDFLGRQIRVNHANK